MSNLIVLIITIAIIAFPIFVTAVEITAFIRACLNNNFKRRFNWLQKFGFIVESVSFLIGIVLEYLVLEFEDVILSANWKEQLINSQLHQPLNSEYMPTITAIGILFLVSRIWLGMKDVNKTPPLQTVLAISGLYAGDIFAVVFTIHIFSALDNNPVLLFIPVNMFLLTARIIINKAREYTPNHPGRSHIEEKPILKKCLDILDMSKLWPAISLILMWPVLGIIIGILLIFGQAPDAIIKAFTETSDFLLSSKVSPQNVQMDEHYLCTVAAGGDRKIVKPLRKGIRHGHEVTVNRQLCIANAFEQELEIHAPKLHRVVRSFYDKYGFPVARLIKKSWVADLVYIIMKPLEWIFVVVIYLTEVHPEDRISIQYTGAGIAYDGEEVRITNIRN